MFHQPSTKCIYFQYMYAGDLALLKNLYLYNFLPFQLFQED